MVLRLHSGGFSAVEHGAPGVLASAVAARGPSSYSLKSQTTGSVLVVYGLSGLRHMRSSWTRIELMSPALAVADSYH